MKLDDLTKKEFPAQARERLQWQLDAIRANQEEAGLLLHALARAASAPTASIALNEYDVAKLAIADMHKADRDAILQSGGILTDEQIKVLKG